jgi:hypothetical protein
MIIAMRRLDKHPAMRASGDTMNVYGPLLGNKQRANVCLGSDDVVRDVTTELCLLCVGSCRGYI